MERKVKRFEYLLIARFVTFKKDQIELMLQLRKPVLSFFIIETRVTRKTDRDKMSY